MYTVQLWKMYFSEEVSEEVSAVVLMVPAELPWNRFMKPWGSMCHTYQL